ncbi:MAG: UPF0149 family protein [Thiobacillus sp.]
MPALPNKPLSDDELAAYADLIHDVSERADLPLSLEGIDGFTTALLVAPRVIEPEEYFPVLFGEQGMSVFKDEAEQRLFMDCFNRRRNEIARALAAPVENLADPKALVPLIMDWEGLLSELPAAEAAEVRQDMPAYGQLWAAGFLIVVEHWEDDWALPEDSKDETFVDACLDPFYALITPEADWTPAERKLNRDEHVASAIWAAYDLREFWLDRGFVPHAPIRKAPEPGRNDPCPCGSGKKYKKCCGADETLH